MHCSQTQNHLQKLRPLGSTNIPMNQKRRYRGHIGKYGLHYNQNDSSADKLVSGRHKVTLLKSKASGRELKCAALPNDLESLRVMETHVVRSHSRSESILCLTRLKFGTCLQASAVAAEMLSAAVEEDCRQGLKSEMLVWCLKSWMGLASWDALVTCSEAGPSLEPHLFGLHSQSLLLHLDMWQTSRVPSNVPAWSVHTWSCQPIVT